MAPRAIDIWLRRDPRGIRVGLKVMGEIEEFFKHWGGGVEQSPSHGRFWKPIDPQHPLRIWSFETSTDGGPDEFGLIQSGGPLINSLNGQVNLAFIRLVGASEGVEFIVESPISTPEMDRLASKLTKTAQSFYINHIRPININCFVGVYDYSKATS